MKSHFALGLAFSLTAGLCTPLVAQALPSDVFFSSFDRGGETILHGTFEDRSLGFQKAPVDLKGGEWGGGSFKDHSPDGFKGSGDWGGSWSYGGDHGGHGGAWCEPITAVPEPGTMPIVLSGLALLGLAVARRRNTM
jgi:hypothetical protein